MSANLPRLINRRNLYIDESLSSYINDLATLNYCDPPGILRGIIFTKGVNKEGDIANSVSPTQTATFERLEALTGVEVSALHTATVHRFAPTITPPTKEFNHFMFPNGSTLPALDQKTATKHLQATTNAQFCPKCLEEKVYHKVIWQVKAVKACILHKCLLLSQCENCLAAVRITDVANSKCAKCAYNLSKASTVHLSDFGLQAQVIIQSWLQQSTSPIQAELLLPDAPGQVLYGLVNRIMFSSKRLVEAAITEIGEVDEKFAPVFLSLKNNFIPPNAIPTYKVYCQYSLAVWSLSNWPENFYFYLEEYEAQVKKFGKKSANDVKIWGADLYSSYFEEMRKVPSFEFLQLAFEQFLLNKYKKTICFLRSIYFQRRPRLSKKAEYLTVFQAAKIANCSRAKISLLLNSGTLTKYPAEDIPSFSLVSRAEAIELRYKIENSIDLPEAAKLLGTSEDVVLDLVKVGLLPRYYYLKEFSKWIFSNRRLIKCSKDVDEKIKLIKLEVGEEQFYVNLTKAAQSLAVIGMNAALILQAVVEGVLPAYYDESQFEWDSYYSIKFRDILFSRNDLTSFAERFKDKNNWVSRERAVKILGVKDFTLNRWIKTGLISPAAKIGTVQYFDRQEVLTFNSRFINSRGAAKVLGVTSLVVQFWRRQGRIKAVSGMDIDDGGHYLYDKNELIKWREERLTFGEALTLLEVSKATLHRWVERGKVVPLDDMGGKQRWFSKEDILRLKEKRA